MKATVGDLIKILQERPIEQGAQFVVRYRDDETIVVMQTIETKDCISLTKIIDEANR